MMKLAQNMKESGLIIDMNDLLMKNIFEGDKIVEI